MWACPNCEARVAPSFEVCWRCGTTREGEMDPDFVTADEAPPIVEPTDYLRLDPGKPVEVDLPEPMPDLVPCFEADSYYEAKLVADRLAAEGCFTSIAGGFRNAKVPTNAMSDIKHRVFIRAQDVPLATPVLEECLAIQKARHARHPG